MFVFGRHPPTPPPTPIPRLSKGGQLSKSFIRMGLTSACPALWVFPALPPNSSKVRSAVSKLELMCIEIRSL